MINNEYLFWVLFFQLLGITFYFSLQNEPSILFTVLLITTFLSILLRSITKKLIYMPFCIILLFFGIGFASAKIKTEIYKSEKLQGEIYVKNAQGTVENLDYFPYGIQAIILTEGKKLVLISKIKNQTSFEPGDIVKFSAKLYSPKAPSSEYSYDQLRNAYFNKIFAFGVILKKVTILERKKFNNLRTLINFLRIRLYQKMLQDLPHEKAVIAGAILLGMKHSIKKETLEQIRLIGISHLFAISGMHMNVIAGVIVSIIAFLLSFSQKFALEYNAIKIASTIALPFLLFYLILSGMQTSTQRAFIMLFILLLSNIFNKSYSPERSIIITLMTLLILEPEELLNPGLQLSFIAVFSLLKIRPNYEIMQNFKPIKLLLQILATSAITTLATAPFTAYHFNTVSLSGIFTNIFAIPIVTQLMIPFGITYIFSSFINTGHIGATPLEFSIDALSYITNFFAKNLTYSISVNSFSGIYLLLIIPILRYITLRDKLKFTIAILACAFLILRFNNNEGFPSVLINKMELGFKDKSKDIMYFPQRHRKNVITHNWNRQNPDLTHIFLPQPNNICVRDVCTYSINNIQIYIFHKKFKNYMILTIKDNIPVYLLTIENGTYSIFIKNNNISIKFSIKNRPWHRLYISAA